MFEFGFILRAKCSGSSKFDLPMFEEFEVRFFDVHSTSSKARVDSAISSFDSLTQHFGAKSDKMVKKSSIFF